MRTRERAHEATIVFVVIVIVVGTSTSFDDDRGDVDAETTREDDRDRARAFGARRRVGAIVATAFEGSPAYEASPSRSLCANQRVIRRRVDGVEILICALPVTKAGYQTPETWRPSAGVR